MDATPLNPDQLDESIWGEAGGILFLRHASRRSFRGLTADERDAVPITEDGRDDAIALGHRLGPSLQVISSPFLRTEQTARAIATGAGSHVDRIPTVRGLADLVLTDRGTYERVIARLTWSGLMHAWLDGSLPPGTLVPCHEFAERAIRDAIAAAGHPDRPRIVAITHNFGIMALLAALEGVRTTVVPYLAGCFVTAERIDEWIPSEAFGRPDLPDPKRK